MDWYSWLSKTGLEPYIIYNYAIIFNQNELEEDDMVYFNHEMLQSMGISIAKHRLEILKLARKSKRQSNIHHSIWWLILAVKETKRYISKQVQELVKNKKDSSLSIVPKQSLQVHSARWKQVHSARWKAAMLKRNNNHITSKQEKMPPSSIIPYGSSPVVQSQKILMLTNGSPLVEHHHSWNNNKASSPPMVYDFGYDEKEEMMDDDEDDGEYYETDVVPVEDIRWDAMFQDLKPT
ncbi:hypothetical protein Leryth_027349 [Lithospermum erythrorhizon]|nr:hypothetical protein Leryth_027349 [Lithospermum erythrorhizon]